jgi:hypothetical protein
MLESLRNTADLIDEQSPEVFEAIIEYINDLAKPESGAPRGD